MLEIRFDTNSYKTKQNNPFLFLLLFLYTSATYISTRLPASRYKEKKKLIQSNPVCLGAVAELRRMCQTV